MYRLNIILFFTGILGLAQTAHSQLNPNNLEHYSEMDGTIIYDIMPDRTGKIWIATQNGLACFDGYEFSRFFSIPGDPESISTILTYSLYEDMHGRIWIGGMESINRYDPSTKKFRRFDFLHLTDFPDYSQPGVISIAEGDQGRIYFGLNSALGFLASKALVYYDPADDQIKQYENDEGLQVQNVSRAFTDRQANIWLVCRNGMFKIDRDGMLMQVPYPETLIPGKLTFNDISDTNWHSVIWNASNSDLIYSYSPPEGVFRSYSLQTLFDNITGSLTTSDVTMDVNGNIWIGTNQGLVYYDRSAKRFEIFKESPERKLARTPINCLQFDSFGNLWIGTASNGLLKYNNQTAFRSLNGSLDSRSPVTPGWVINLHEAHDGKIWFSTLGDVADYSGINDLDPVSLAVTKYPYRSIMPGLEAIFSFIEYKPGEFYINSNLGFLKYYPGTNKWAKLSFPGLPDTITVSKFYRDTRNNLWILTYNGLYLFAEQSGVCINYDLKLSEGTSTGSNQITDAFESRDSGLWLLTNDGLYRYDYPSGKITRHGNHKESGEVFLSQDINSFYEGQDGIAWVGTWQGGLSRLDVKTGKIKTYTTTDGLPSMSIQGILADEKNHALWLSTFEGLSRFDMTTGVFNNFSLEDGIQGRLFSDGSYLKSSSGHFIFGGSNGITIFDPDDIEKNSIPPNVFISDFKFANTSLLRAPAVEKQEGLAIPGIVKLKYFQNNISITYSGVHYANPSRNKFSYRLENFDEGWRDVGNQRTAFYYNLPPGQYTFHVKACNNNGVWNETGAFLQFIITPPWWRTWWAYGFYGLIFLFAVFLLDRIQRKRIIQKERALMKEKELAHAREIEKAYHKLQTTQTQLVHAEKMASLGELTAGIAHEIQNPLNFVNNFSEVSVELIEEMEKELLTVNNGHVSVLASDLKQNLSKINAHGKRASIIVKGMLEHSRKNPGLKEPADLNALADEFLRLAYYGNKARDKSFHAEFKTEFDETLPKVNMISQEIGRVLLNLINNAFYAVSQKAKQGMNGYIPTVWVVTKNQGDIAVVRIRDNGGGIPAEVLDKIFQPFFTTKPTGEGTGLGLSLSFEIITIGHSGELKADTKEGEGTEFIIELPLNS